jgi:hypothetical protein
MRYVASSDIKTLLGIHDDDSTSLKYSSILWPGFGFHAGADEYGLLESAQYRHTRRDSPSVNSPAELPTWSVDVVEFAVRFGPIAIRRKWPIFDEVLPAHEEYEYLFNGDRYGARFTWGLLLSSSMYWE